MIEEMKRAVVAVALPLLLSGCGHPDEIRDALARCELDKGAQVPNYFDHYDGDYLEACMQRKGFVQDSHLIEDSGTSCSEDLYLDEHAACYRPDNDLAKVRARLLETKLGRYLTQH